MYPVLPCVWSTAILTVLTCITAEKATKTTEDYTGELQREGPECELPVDTGSCTQQFSRYYFDKTSGQCKLFSYTGCGGNLNNFLSLSECNERCVCSRKKTVGTCNSKTPRYFYNTGTGLCELFIYSGCGGNINNFLNEASCENVCKVHAGIRRRCLRRPEFGSCSNQTVRYYYDTRCGCCQQFFYSGCEGNNNNFETEELCLQKCEYVTPGGTKSGNKAPTSPVSLTSSTTTRSISATPKSSGSKAIIIQTNTGPSGDRVNNIFQQLLNMMQG